jgi:hypothetical protein
MQLESIERGSWHGMTAIVGPFAIGSAVAR